MLPKIGSVGEMLESSGLGPLNSSSKFFLKRVLIRFICAPIAFVVFDGFDFVFGSYALDTLIEETRGLVP